MMNTTKRWLITARRELVAYRKIERILPALEGINALRDFVNGTSVRPEITRELPAEVSIVAKQAALASRELAKALLKLKKGAHMREFQLSTNQALVDTALKLLLLPNTHESICNRDEELITLCKEAAKALARAKNTITESLESEEKETLNLKARAQRILKKYGDVLYSNEVRGIQDMLHASARETRFFGTDTELQAELTIVRETILLAADVATTNGLCAVSNADEETAEKMLRILQIERMLHMRCAEANYLEQRIKKERKKGKLEKLKKKHVELLREIDGLLRTRLTIIFPNSRAELSTQSTLANRRNVLLLDVESEECETCAKMHDAQKPLPRSETEDRALLAERFPALYAIIVKQETAERIAEKRRIGAEVTARREHSKMLKKLQREMHALGVPPEFFAPRINAGLLDADRIFQEYETEKAKKVRPETTNGKKTVASATKIKTQEETACEIADALIKTRFGVGISGLGHAEKQLVLKTQNEINNFVLEYLRYLAQTKGTRGTFGKNGYCALSSFRERHQQQEREYGGWRIFALQHADNRIVICVKPETSSIALYTVETEHEKYASDISEFNPSRISGWIDISCGRAVDITVKGSAARANGF